MKDPFDFDLFVIGAGSGGVRGARMAAGYGARVAVAEEARLGGTCVNVGCIPKKLLVYGAAFRKQLKLSGAYGWKTSLEGFDWSTLIQNKDKEIARLNGLYGRILDRAGVTRIRGRAVFRDAHTVEVAGKRYRARHILIAVGGRPYKPSNVRGIEHVITSDEAFALPTLPARVMVVGGGYIGVEFAGIFHGMGADVTLLHRRDRVLRGFDEDLRRALTEQLGQGGIRMRLNTTANHFEKRGHDLVAHFSDGSTQAFDQILCATGRRPYTSGLGLDAAGVTTDEKGAIEVDDYRQTSVPHIYAVGDVTDRLNLTPIALAEGMAVAATLFDNRPTKALFCNVPTAVFSQPELATVGLTEQQARKRYSNVRIYRSSFRALKLTITSLQERSMMKLVVDADSDKVLGVHVLGDSAAEMVQGFAVALQCGVTKTQLDRTIGIHPTAAEELVTMRTPVALTPTKPLRDPCG